MNKLCPLCKSKKIKLTDITEAHFDSGNATSIRLYCSKCRKAMTVTGILVSTANEVDN